VELLEYIREKIDLDYYFQRILNKNRNTTNSISNHNGSMVSARSIVRGKIVEEILETEIRYHHSLTLVQDMLIKPLRNGGKKKPTHELLWIIFDRLGALVKHHKTFSQVLGKTIKAANHPWEARLGDIFYKQTNFFDDYGRYLDKYYDLVSVLPEIVEESPFFKEIKQNFEQEMKKTTQLDLQSYLVLPVQRISRYLLLLKELLKYTDDSSASEPRRGIELAIDKIDKQLGGLNKSISSNFLPSTMSYPIQKEGRGNRWLFRVLLFCIIVVVAAVAIYFSLPHCYSYMRVVEQKAFHHTLVKEDWLAQLWLKVGHLLYK